MKKDILQTTWVKYGFPAIEKFNEILKMKNISITRNELKAFYKNQGINYEYKNVKRKSYGHITSRKPNALWQGDLIDYSSLAKDNKNYRWILIMIDVFSRKGYVKALKSKSADDVLQGLRDVLNSTNNKPIVFMTDNGNEFTNKQLKEYLEKNKIIHITNEIGDHRALGIIDRFVKTIKTIIQKNLDYFQNNDWFTRYKDIVEVYNETPHSGIYGITPNNAPKRMHYINMLNLHKKMKETKPIPHRVGSMVRVRIGVDEKFRKGYKPKWSKDHYEILETHGNSYLLNDGTNKLHRHYDVIASV